MQDASTILAFDTTGAYCGVALWVNGIVTAARHEEMAKGQAERLFPLLEDVLADGALGFGDLDALGVGVGPGNFTGIRISVSAARGLALSLGIPAIGVSLFDVLAEGAPDGPLLLSLRAARDRVYLQSREADRTGEIIVAKLDDLPATAPNTLVIGDYSAEIAASFGLTNAPAAFAPASAIARIAARHSGPARPPAPLYVSDGDSRLRIGARGGRRSRITDAGRRSCVSTHRRWRKMPCRFRT